MTPRPIPLLVVSGSHREVGRSIGSACAETIRDSVAFDARIPEGRTRAEQLALADRYREMTAMAYPWFMEELEGAAEAADVDPRALFAADVEEIWYPPRTRQLEGRCTDIVVASPLSEEGHVLVAHNNDMPRTYQDQLVAIEWRVDDDPVVLSIGNGLWTSAGWNSAGLSFTGNELAPLDERIGVPREIQFRAMLRQPSMELAVREALRDDRASSYNHVLASNLGDVVNVEGSATDAELTGVGDRGALVHTNHYVCERMLRYEGDPDYVPHSEARFERASKLVSQHAPGTVTAEGLRAILSDHDGAPDCLCRHPEVFGGPNDSATAFWCIADVTEMRVAYGRGNPCDSIAQEYPFILATSGPTMP